MKILIAAALIVSASAFAEPMGADAVEMASVLTHPQVRDCIEDFNVSQMVNVSVDKRVARCPGCNTYTVTGFQRNIDTPSTTPSVLKIIGKGVWGTFGGFVQTYTCEVTE